MDIVISIIGMLVMAMVKITKLMIDLFVMLIRTLMSLAK